jgi:hypothetical protein
MALVGASTPLFEREYASVQNTFSSAGELIRTSKPQRHGDSTEASWTYEFAGDGPAAMKSFMVRIHPAYEAVRQTSSELAFARFDGHDSFHLTLSFKTKRDVTTVDVALRAFPD